MGYQIEKYDMRLEINAQMINKFFLLQLMYHKKLEQNN